MREFGDLAPLCRDSCPATRVTSPDSVSERLVSCWPVFGFWLDFLELPPRSTSPPPRVATSGGASCLFFTVASSEGLSLLTPFGVPIDSWESVVAANAASSTFGFFCCGTARSKVWICRGTRRLLAASKNVCEKVRFSPANFFDNSFSLFNAFRGCQLSSPSVLVSTDWYNEESNSEVRGLFSSSDVEGLIRPTARRTLKAKTGSIGFLLL